MDRGQQEIQGETAGPNLSVQQNILVDDCDNQCLPSNSNDLNQEKECSQSDENNINMECVFNNLHHIFKDKNLMEEIFSNLFNDFNNHFQQLFANYDEADILINTVGYDDYFKSYIEHLVNISPLSNLQSDPIMWAAYMRGKKDNARNATKTPTEEPQSANDLPSTSNMKIPNFVSVEEMNMLKIIKNHFKQYQLLKDKEHKLFKITKYGARLMDLDIDN